MERLTGGTKWESPVSGALHPAMTSPAASRRNGWMGKLIYSALGSLDGYIEDEQGRFDWAEPDEEVHTFANDLSRRVGTYLLGRRMYEVLVFWESVALTGPAALQYRDFAEIWRAADKIVYSKTLDVVSSARTRIEREFDPEAVRELKAAAGEDLTIGGLRARRARLQGRARRRMSRVPRAHHRGTRQARPPRGLPPEARTAGRTPVRKRRGPPPLPHGPQRLIADAGSRLRPEASLTATGISNPPRSETPRLALESARIARCISGDCPGQRPYPHAAFERPVHNSSRCRARAGTRLLGQDVHKPRAARAGRTRRRPRTGTAAGRGASRPADALQPP